MSDDFNIASRIASRFLGAHTFEQVSGKGSCNKAFVATGANRKIVIRLNNDRDIREFDKENWCMQQARALGVHTPEPLGHGMEQGWNYSAQTYEGDLHGEELADQPKLWRWLGAEAAKFHRIATKGFGAVLENEKTGHFSENWDDYVTGNLDALNSKTSCEKLNDRQIGNLEQRFESLASVRPVFGLCHGDLMPRNVVASGDRLSLIDWGCAEAHIVPHFDLREILREHDFEGSELAAFAEGYGVGLNEMRLEIENVILIGAFDLTRWARDRAPEMLAKKESQFHN